MVPSKKRMGMWAMSGMQLREDENGGRQTRGAREEDAALFPAAAMLPKVKIRDRYTGRYRWTGPERLWLAAPEDPSLKK